jgi:hypothetical protein
MAQQVPAGSIRAREREHEAWLQLVKEWDRLHPQPAGFNLNAPICNSLVRAIELWGEQLVALRVLQSPEEIRKIRQEKADAYHETLS